MTDLQKRIADWKAEREEREKRLLEYADIIFGIEASIKKKGNKFKHGAPRLLKKYAYYRMRINLILDIDDDAIKAAELAMTITLKLFRPLLDKITDLAARREAYAHIPFAIDDALAAHINEIKD